MTNLIGPNYNIELSKVVEYRDGNFYDQNGNIIIINANNYDILIKQLEKLIEPKVVTNTIVKEKIVYQVIETTKYEVSKTPKQDTITKKKLTYNPNVGGDFKKFIGDIWIKIDKYQIYFRRNNKVATEWRASDNILPYSYRLKLEKMGVNVDRYNLKFN